LLSSAHALEIDSKWLSSRVGWVNVYIDLPKLWCLFVYDQPKSSEEDLEQTYLMYGTFVLAVNRLREILDKIKEGKIQVKWEDNETPNPWPIISIPEVLNRKVQVRSVSVSISMAHLGYGREISIDSEVSALLRGAVVDKVVIPESLLSPSHSAELKNTEYWWDRQRALFLIRIVDSYPAIEFEVTKDCIIESFQYVWNSNKAPILADKFSTLTIDKIWELAKEFPSKNYQFMLDNCLVDKAKQEEIKRNLAMGNTHFDI
jgi:hypothetical protein